MAASARKLSLNRLGAVKMFDFQATKHIEIEMCRSHQQEALQYYCKSHGQFGCSLCKEKIHKRCAGVSYIPDIAGAFEESKEYKEFIDKLDQITKRAVDSKDKAKENITASKKDKFDAVTLIRKFRKEINDKFDLLEDSIIKEAKSIRDENLQKMDTVTKACEALVSEIKTSLSDIEKKQKATDSAPWYIAMKRTEKKIASFDERLKYISKNNKIVRYSFERDDGIKAIIGNIRSLGELPRCNDISGITVVSESQLAIVDKEKRCVKLFNWKQNKTVSKMTLSSQPWDIAAVPPNQVAVTFPSEMKIQMFNVADELSSLQQFTVSGACFAITYFSKQLLVLFANSIQFLDVMTGSVFRELKLQNNGRPLCKLSRYMAVSPDNSTIYLSDSRANTVTSLTLDGDVKTTYSSKDLIFPEGLAVDKDGYLYVCGVANIHRLNQDCTRGQVLFGDGHGLRMPQSVAYSGMTNQLFVGMAQCETVKVLQLQ